MNTTGWDKSWFYKVKYVFPSHGSSLSSIDLFDIMNSFVSDSSLIIPKWENHFDVRNRDAVNKSFESVRDISDGVLVSSDFLRYCWVETHLTAQFNWAKVLLFGYDWWFWFIVLSRNTTFWEGFLAWQQLQWIVFRVLVTIAILTETIRPTTSLSLSQATSFANMWDHRKAVGGILSPGRSKNGAKFHFLKSNIQKAVPFLVVSEVGAALQVSHQPVTRPRCFFWADGPIFSVFIGAIVPAIFRKRSYFEWLEY
jgi:hypothetical protein